jgi:arsenate reductase (thioredoxin)
VREGIKGRGEITGKVVSVMKKKILFLCTGNSARSQMAEGVMRYFRGDEFEVFSAGVEPKGVHPQAIVAMLEIGVDISRHNSKHVDDLSTKEFDYIITLCDSAAQNCPVFLGKGQKIHRSFSDPAAVQGKEQEVLEAFRKVRDELKQFILRFKPD